MDELQQFQIPGGSNFHFSGFDPSLLGAVEYTIGVLMVDTTGSTNGFEHLLRDMAIAVIEAGKKNPRKEFMLMRVCVFNTTVGIKEIVGFMPVTQIDTAAFPQFTSDGMTNLYDAGFDMVGSALTYARSLVAKEMSVNAFCAMVTDGLNNQSRIRDPGEIKQQIESAVKSEAVESIQAVLIGINTAHYQQALDDFRRDAGFDHYFDAGDVTPGKIAKVAGWVSNSLSSTSQQLGTGGKSQIVPQF